MTVSTTDDTIARLEGQLAAAKAEARILARGVMALWRVMEHHPDSTPDTWRLEVRSPGEGEVYEIRGSVSCGPVSMICDFRPGDGADYDRHKAEVLILDASAAWLLAPGALGEEWRQPSSPSRARAQVPGSVAAMSREELIERLLAAEAKLAQADRGESQ